MLNICTKFKQRFITKKSSNLLLNLLYSFVVPAILGEFGSDEGSINSETLRVVGLSALLRLIWFFPVIPFLLVSSGDTVSEAAAADTEAALMRKKSAK